MGRAPIFARLIKMYVFQTKFGIRLAELHRRRCELPDLQCEEGVQIRCPVSLTQRSQLLGSDCPLFQGHDRKQLCSIIWIPLGW